MGQLVSLIRTTAMVVDMSMILGTRESYYYLDKDPPFNTLCSGQIMSVIWYMWKIKVLSAARLTSTLIKSSRKKLVYHAFCNMQI